MVIRAQESGSLTQRDELWVEHTRDTFFWTTALIVDACSKTQLLCGPFIHRARLVSTIGPRTLHRNTLSAARKPLKTMRGARDPLCDQLLHNPYLQFTSNIVQYIATTTLSSI